MRINYIIRRIGFFLVIVWVAASVNFFLPRLTGQDPIREKLMREAMLGGATQAGMEQIIETYGKKFGLDRPLYLQYLSYLGDVARFDFNYSISQYPNRVLDMILDALPWTAGLLSVAFLLSFVVGTFLGALFGWPRSPRFVMWLFGPLLSLNAIPYFLLGLVLLYFLAFALKWLPSGGGFERGTLPTFSLHFVLDVAYHAILPALSILLAQLGGWALGMRAMMVTTQGEDYMVFADAKGLSERTLFLRYAMRNAILPQVTGLALVLGQLISGAVLVEIVFQYPGVGTLLWRAIRETDYFVVQGVVFFSIVTIGLATLLLDLIYPLIDPRISYAKR
ncbi:MAG: ABC transporter permease [Caldilineaceae bacterium]|nr:ABC transporter permease [Caldilineaceae bacterium]